MKVMGNMSDSRTETLESAATTAQTITLAQDADGIWFISMNSHPGLHTQGKTIQEALTRLAESYEAWVGAESLNEKSAL